MVKPRNLFKASSYILKCAFAAGLIMFICMAAGELFINPQMFKGFLAKPKIWFLIFLESAVWMIPMALISLPFLWSLRNLKNSKAKPIVISGWATLGIAAIITYKIIYFPNDWAAEKFTRADIVFGWTIPCVIILITNAILSLSYLNSFHHNLSEQKPEL